MKQSLQRVSAFGKAIAVVMTMVLISWASTTSAKDLLDKAEAFNQGAW